MRTVLQRYPIGLLVAITGLCLWSPSLWAKEDPPKVSGEEIVRHCGYKYAGEDQRSRFVVVIRSNEGLVRRSEYLRVWKDFKGQEGIADKMLLFTVYPPEAKGSAFMRVAYLPAHSKNVDQWIYLPQMRKIRRVSIRDPGDRFLNSNLTYEDVSPRPIEADTHNFLGVKTLEDKDGENAKSYDFYVVESIPREQNSLYGKRVRYFLKTEDWEDCVNTRIDYFDHKGELIKDQLIKWQKVGKAWVWDRVLVRGTRSFDASIFQISDVQVNTGLDADLFTARTLRIGPSAIPKLGDAPGPAAPDTPDSGRDRPGTSPR